MFSKWYQNWLLKLRILRHESACYFFLRESIVRSTSKCQENIKSYFFQLAQIFPKYILWCWWFSCLIVSTPIWHTTERTRQYGQLDSSQTYWGHFGIWQKCSTGFRRKCYEKGLKCKLGLSINMMCLWMLFKCNVPPRIDIFQIRCEQGEFF